MSRRALGLLFAFLAALFYGLNTPYFRLLADGGVHAADIALMRVALVGGVALAVSRLRGDALAVPRPARLAVAAAGVATAGIGIGYGSAVAHLPVGLATVLFYTYPFFVLLAAPLVDGTRPSALQLGVFAVGFLGLVVALNASFAMVTPIGVACAAVAALSGAAQLFLANRASRSVAPSTILLWVQLTILPIALLTLWLTTGPTTLGAVAASWYPLALNCGFFVIAIALQFEASRLLPPPVVGLMLLLEPVVSIAAAAAILDERLSTQHYIGSALVLAALITHGIVELRGGAARRPAEAAA